MQGTFTRPAESVLHRVLAGSAGLFRADDYPEQLAAAAAEAQLPVTTGRRIAVLGTRGGAGKSTVAALLARSYAAMRTDTVAALDLAPGAGTLGLRLGVPHAPPLEAVQDRLGRATPPSLRGLAALLTVAAPGNLLVAGRRRPAAGPTADLSAPAVWTPAAPLPPPVWTPASPALQQSRSGTENADGSDDAARLSRIISRYCAITVYDCAPGLTDPGALRAAGQSHLAVFVTPASVAGLEDALEYAAVWRHHPVLAAVPLLVLVVQSAGGRGVTPAGEAGRLRRAGIDAVHLGYDRHLAAGVELSLPLLSRRTRLEALALAACVLSAASDGSGFRRAAGQTSGRGRHR